MSNISSNRPRRRVSSPSSRIRKNLAPRIAIPKGCPDLFQAASEPKAAKERSWPLSTDQHRPSPSRHKSKSSSVLQNQNRVYTRSTYHDGMIQWCSTGCVGVGFRVKGHHDILAVASPGFIEIYPVWSLVLTGYELLRLLGWCKRRGHKLYVLGRSKNRLAIILMQSVKWIKEKYPSVVY